MTGEEARKIAKQAAREIGLTEEQIEQLGLRMYLIMDVYTEEDTDVQRRSH